MKTEDTIIVRFKGGLGNQMFEYALYYALSRKGRRVKGDRSSYSIPGAMPFELIEVFPKVKIEWASEKEIDYYQKKQAERSVLEKIAGRFDWGKRYDTAEKEDGVYDKRVFDIKKGFIDGYWQAEQYFKEYREELLELYHFQIENEELQKYAADLPVNSVSVHIRRGDYLKHPEIYGGICEEAYYHKAMEFFRKKLENPVFYFFSNDTEWVKKRFAEEDCVIVKPQNFSEYTNWYDLYLMSSCSHNIIANSSFSWWGAWLNRNPESIVLAPSKWLNGNGTPDIWCKQWMKL